MLRSLALSRSASRVLAQNNSVSLTNLCVRSLSTSTSAGSDARTVRHILEDKREGRQGDELKTYLKKQFKLNTVKDTASVATAIEKMVTGATSALVVMNEANEFQGILTTQNYVRFAHQRNQSLRPKSDKEVLVKDIATPKEKTLTVEYVSTIDHCLTLMADNNIRFLPVLHKGALHGILSPLDFMAQPSRFEPELRRAVFAEEGVDIVTDDYSFYLTESDSDKVKKDLQKRLANAKAKEAEQQL